MLLVSERKDKEEGSLDSRDNRHTGIQNNNDRLGLSITHISLNKERMNCSALSESENGSDMDEFTTEERAVILTSASHLVLHCFR